jgi:hypothetical protein
LAVGRGAALPRPSRRASRRPGYETFRFPQPGRVVPHREWNTGTQHHASGVAILRGALDHAYHSSRVPGWAGLCEISDETMSNRNALSRAGAGFMALLLSVAPALAGSTFCDKFANKNDPAWGDQDGSWTIAKHRYYATMPDNNPLTYTDLDDYQSLKTFTLDVTVNDVYDGGIWLRSQYNGGAPNGVLLVVGGACSNYTGLYWHVVQNGNPGQCLDEMNVSGLEGSNAKIRVVVKGDTYTAYVNGAMVKSLTDTTYATGSAGLYDNSAAPEETFSDFCLKEK